MSSTKEAAIESAIREWHSQPEDIPSNEQRAIKHGVEVGYDAGYESARSKWTAINSVEESKIVERFFDKFMDEWSGLWCEKHGRNYCSCFDLEARDKTCAALGLTVENWGVENHQQGGE